ncbi:universal stress protein [Azohydromonas sp.]|uniref:universal stress protein n=1 Tax=Azohydromonas sp. TaxID=1872666 RepID=UPI002D04B796|nr:universal stress protein [Azohydromonas sp.]HMM86161.1 universal stress protein [Azohydromonas sp.]
MFKRILVPVDGSDLSTRAIDASLELARPLGATVVGFVAEPMPTLPAVGRPPTVVARENELHDQRTAAHAREVLSAFEQRAQAAGVGFEGHFLQAPLVDQAIVDAAESKGCDLILMVTHGRGAFGEFLFGSHTKAVLSRCKLPLLVLH